MPASDPIYRACPPLFNVLLRGFSQPPVPAISHPPDPYGLRSDDYAEKEGQPEGWCTRIPQNSQRIHHSQGGPNPLIFPYALKSPYHGEDMPQLSDTNMEASKLQPKRQRLHSGYAPKIPAEDRSSLCAGETKSNHQEVEQTEEAKRLRSPTSQEVLSRFPEQQQRVATMSASPSVLEHDRAGLTTLQQHAEQYALDRYGTNSIEQPFHHRKRPHDFPDDYSEGAAKAASRMTSRELNVPRSAVFKGQPLFGTEERGNIVTDKPPARRSSLSFNKIKSSKYLTRFTASSCSRDRTTRAAVPGRRKKKALRCIPRIFDFRLPIGTRILLVQPWNNQAIRSTLKTPNVTWQVCERTCLDEIFGGLPEESEASIPEEVLRRLRTGAQSSQGF